MADDRVDRNRHDEAEDDERQVLDAFGHGTRDDRGGGSGEHELEEELGEQRNAGPVDGAVDALVVGGGGGAVVSARSRTTNLPCRRMGVPLPNIKPQPDDPVTERCDGEHDEVLRKDVHAVLRAAHARFDGGETQVHEEHEEACNHHPHRIEHDLDIGIVVGGAAGAAAGVAVGVRSSSARTVLGTAAIPTSSKSPKIDVQQNVLESGIHISTLQKD